MAYGRKDRKGLGEKSSLSRPQFGSVPANDDQPPDL